MEVEILSPPTFSDHVAALRYLLLVHGVSDIPHLAGGEVLEEVVVLDGLLDEVLGVEVLVDGGDGEGGAAGHALPRHSLLLVEGKLPRHTVAVLQPWVTDWVETRAGNEPSRSFTVENLLRDYAKWKWNGHKTYKHS